jgi:hypothetical protein
MLRMACDYLSILSTSCECERAFSKARRTITADRDRLSGATIESIQLVGCGSTVQTRMRQKVVVLRELQRAIIYTTR